MVHPYFQAALALAVAALAGGACARPHTCGISLCCESHSWVGIVWSATSYSPVYENKPALCKPACSADLEAVPCEPRVPKLGGSVSDLEARISVHGRAQGADYEEDVTGGRIRGLLRHAELGRV